MFVVSFPAGRSVTVGAVVEATALLVNSFVEGVVVQQSIYTFDVEELRENAFLIRASLRHGTPQGRFEQSQAFAVLYLVYAGWVLARATVEVSGPWQDSFPLQGGTDHLPEFSTGDLPHLFQDDLTRKKQTFFPSLETLNEVHRVLVHQAEWDLLRVDPQFIECFPEAVQNQQTRNNVRLHHRDGWKVDLVLKDQRVVSHILDDQTSNGMINPRHMICERNVEIARTWWDAWVGHCPVGHCPVDDLSPRRVLVLPNEVAILSVSPSISRYQIIDRSTLERPLQIDFGAGFHPGRAVEYWLQLATRFGEAQQFDVAVGCCEQAIATAKALISNEPGITIKPPLGRSAKESLDDAEIEYLRWIEARESASRPLVEHDRWNDKLVARGKRELVKLVGDRWEEAISEVIEAINREHYASEDYHQKIGAIGPFAWYPKGDIGSLRYARLFGRDLMVAKVPKAAISALGYDYSGLNIPVWIDFTDIFTLTLGDTKFWGSVERRALVLCSNPTKVYFI